ncbi:MAG TPA: hypothetical protein VK308_10905 [Pyrinomonadaceae bacterium]|nr:hypothetical protein [Pyrinomonadaceae bacterium]
MINIKLIGFVSGILLLGANTDSNAQGAGASRLKQPDSNSVIQVSEDRLVSVDKTDFPLIEPHLAVNPKKPSNLLAGAIVVTKPDLSSLDCAAFISHDDGNTWKRRDFGLVQLRRSLDSFYAGRNGCFLRFGDNGKRRTTITDLPF